MEAGVGISIMVALCCANVVVNPFTRIGKRNK